MSFNARLIEKIEKNNSGCWLWKAAKNTKGYGMTTSRCGKLTHAHRVVFEEYVGIIPNGKQLDHLCRIKNCVNPNHLEIVTQKENILRGDGPSAINARKTYCNKGHKFDEKNTYNYLDGRRKCRKCCAEFERRKKSTLKKR